MFRPMRRSNQALTEEECISILQNEPRGVLSVMGEDGYPYAFPMNQLYLEGKLYFHCAKTGHKLDALHMNNKASFCIMDQGFHKENDWALNIKSVIAFGKLEMIYDMDRAKKIVYQLGLKHYPTPESVDIEMEKAFSRVQLLEFTIDHMTGKLVNES